MALKNALRFSVTAAGPSRIRTGFPVSSAGQKRLADHQRTLTAGNVPRDVCFVKQRAEKTCDVE
jgi:hypothetical protein